MNVPRSNVPSFTSVSPMIPSFAIRKTSTFLIEALGFSPTMDDAAYTILEKDGVILHLLPAGSDIGQMEFYLVVDNVDELWTSLRTHVGGLRFKEPFDRDYGMREIHLELPHTNTLMFVGQQVRTT